MALPLISLLPEPPNPDSPSSFNALAYPFTVAQRTMATQLNALLAQLNELTPTLAGGGWATTGGTANAIMLTAGYSAQIRGMQIRFRATTSNTGAATINLDGKGAIACRTVTGAVLPAGYIRSDVDTTATFDGTYWVLDRDVEEGSNPNGYFRREASGRIWCGIESIRFDQTNATNILVSWARPAVILSTKPKFNRYSVDNVPASSGIGLRELGVLRCASNSSLYYITNAIGGANWAYGSYMDGIRLETEGFWY